jgi:hypothetical protein
MVLRRGLVEVAQDGARGVLRLHLVALGRQVRAQPRRQLRPARHALAAGREQLEGLRSSEAARRRARDARGLPHLPI